MSSLVYFAILPFLTSSISCRLFEGMKHSFGQFGRDLVVVTRGAFELAYLVGVGDIL